MKFLGKLKIYELAKEMDMESKKLMEIALENGIKVKSHLSSISEEDCQTLKKIAKGTSSKKLEKTVSDTKKTMKNTETPVIIRREIIISEDEMQNKELEKKKKEEQVRKSDVGFINPNRNKDYNIVYRNKPTKPLTMNELFGIGKKEEKEKKIVEPQVKEIKEEVKQQQRR